ncbi:MAG: hypothetical protein WBG36_06965 [Ornithinimicrobium sp.]
MRRAADRALVKSMTSQASHPEFAMNVISDMEQRESEVMAISLASLV